MPGLAPLGLLVDGLVGDPPQPPDHGAVDAAGRRGHPPAGRLVHERHELVGEARHRAADADAADVGAAADAVDPAPLGDVAVDHRAPAAELHDALGRAVLGGEVALLVVAGPVAALVHGGPEEPLRPQLVVERDHRRLAGGLVEQVEDRLGQVVGVRRAARDAHDRAGPPSTSSPSPGSRARPWRRWGCRPWRGCRRRRRRCPRPARPGPWGPGGRATRWWSSAGRSRGRCRSRTSSPRP